MTLRSTWPLRLQRHRLRDASGPIAHRLYDIGGSPMTAPQMTAPSGALDRRPRDEEIDVYGLTHPGKVRKENQDHFLICALKKQMVVLLTSLPDADHLM